MLHKVYSVRDSKGEIFLPPFTCKTHGEAERTFTEYTRREDSLLFKYPEDYDLYYLGEFDDKAGVYQVLDTPQHLLKAVQVKARVQ